MPKPEFSQRFRNSSSYSLIAELLSIWDLVVSLLHMMCGKLKGPKKVEGSIPGDLLHLSAIENAQNRQTVFVQQPVGSFFSKTYIFTTALLPGFTGTQTEVSAL